MLQERKKRKEKKYKTTVLGKMQHGPGTENVSVNSIQLIRGRVICLKNINQKEIRLY